MSLLTEKQINTKISGIKRSTKALRDNIQEVLVSAASHVYKHGDVTMYNKLFDATVGANRKLIAKWIQEHGFGVLQKDGTFRSNKKMRRETDFNDSVEVAFAYLSEHAPLWYAKDDAPSVARELDLLSRVQSVINSAQKDDAKVKPVDLDKYRELRDQLDEVMSMYCA